MNSKAIELLEFPKVRDRVAGFTSFSGGKALALALLPSHDYDWVYRQHQEVQDAARLLELRPNFSLGGAHDVRPIVEQASRGGLLQPLQLQDVFDTVQAARNLARALERVSGQVPLLWAAAEQLPDCSDLEEEIERCIGPRGDVLDRASPTLARLRQQVHQAHDRLTDKLQELLNSARGRQILQEPVITLRNGRYVVPVKADFRGELRGIVHDISASGATIFMEPLDAVDLGNAWRQLQLEEEREVERVLRRLSDLVADYEAEIHTVVSTLSVIDLALARAKYGRSINGRSPYLWPPGVGIMGEQRGGGEQRNSGREESGDHAEARRRGEDGAHTEARSHRGEGGFGLPEREGEDEGSPATPGRPPFDSAQGRRWAAPTGPHPLPQSSALSPESSPQAWPRLGPLRLVQARHPLLTGNVVPISVDLADSFFILVITGPNTGGKTVALKTIGLLALMAQAGIPVPAEEGSSLPVFHDIFADIGDEQSIEQSLSTFSSHMRNVMDILREADDQSLVLLDELAAGTDPTEGSALGRAIITYLVRRGIPTVATTHHSDLKAFAHSTPGVRNASVEFDPETLSPTYRLQVGLPGWSNAIAIATRLGLPEEVVSEARSLLSPEDLRVEQLLGDIQRERTAAEAALQQAQADRRRAENIRRRLDVQLHELEENKGRQLQEARSEVQREVDRLRQLLRKSEQQIERALREQRREELVAAAARLQSTEKQLESRRWRPPAEHRRRRQETRAPLILAPGARARLAGLGQVVEIMSPPSAEGEVEVQIGSFRAKVRVDQLEPASATAVAAAVQHGDGATRYPPSWTFSGGNAEPVPAELHLRGLRVEEALGRLDDYLDQAFRAGLPAIRIVHGKGTGAMRRAVRDVLAAHPLIRSFESAPPEAGGEGVTVATLQV